MCFRDNFNLCAKKLRILVLVVFYQYFLFCFLVDVSTDGYAMPNLQASKIERSNLEKSPKIQRKFDVSERECQRSVIDRARLTLLNLTDVWKSKIDTHKVHKSFDSPATANRKALDVLTVWAKHRRSPSADPTHSAVSHKRNPSIENHVNEHWRSDGKTYIKIVNAKGNKPKCSSLATNKPKQKCKSSNSINNEIENLSKESHVYWRQRSYDDGLNHLNKNGMHHDDNDAVGCHFAWPKQRQRRRSCGTLIPSEMHPDNGFFANKTYCDNEKPDEKSKLNSNNNASVVKARLKFKKIKTCDDLYANENVKKKSIKLLKRQTSVLPIITIDDCDTQVPADIVDVAKKSNANEQQSNGRTPLPSPSPSPNDCTKRRKKLSFREPVIFNEKLQEIREKHSLKNRSNSHTQVNDDEKNSSIESMDFSQVAPLEVLKKIEISSTKCKV